MVAETVSKILDYIILIRLIALNTVTLDGTPFRLKAEFKRPFTAPTVNRCRYLM